MNCPVSPRKEEEIGDVSGSEGDVWDRAMEPFEHEEGEPEEARKVVGVREEEQPSEEVKEHMENHMPFRSWCPFCIKGKAGSAWHRKREEAVWACPSDIDGLRIHGKRGRRMSAARSARSGASLMTMAEPSVVSVESSGICSSCRDPASRVGVSKQ